MERQRKLSDALRANLKRRKARPPDEPAEAAPGDEEPRHIRR